MRNCAWRLGPKFGAAYVEDRGLAADVLKMEGIAARPADAAMATYYSPKGKAFAWQVRFSLDRWGRVARRLGLEIPKKATKSSPKQKQQGCHATKLGPAKTSGKKRAK